MRKALGIVSVLAMTLILAMSGFAATVTKNLTVTWTYPVAEEANISGFKVYNQAGAVVMDNIPKNLRTRSAPYTFDDSQPQAFQVIAYDATGKQSDPTGMGIWTPKYKALTGTGTITIEIKDLVQ